MSSRYSIRIFYILLCTQTLSIIGSQMTGLAISIKVFNDTGAVMPLALSSFFRALPLILGAGLAGIAADRWDRRRILIGADIGQAVGTMFLLWSISTGAFLLWHLYTVSFLQAFFGIFQHPAFQASVTMLIPDDQRDRANAVQQLTWPAAGLLSPALAGVLFSIIGINGIILIDLLTFLTAIVVVLSIRIPQPAQSSEGQAARRSVWSEATAGFQVLWQRRTLFYLICYITFVNFLWNLFAVVQTPYILTVTGSEAMLGFLFSVSSAGLSVGALMMTVWKIMQRRVQVILLMFIAIGVSIVPFGIVRNPVLLTVVFFVLSMPHPVVNTLLTSLLQLKTPPDVQGRVFAAVTQMALLAAPVALLIGGFLADHVLEPAVGGPGWSVVEPLVGSQPGAGMGLLIVLSGAVYTVCSVLLYRWPRMRRLETELPDYVATPASE